MERDQASKFINDLLRLMVSRDGSDLFLTGEFPPAIKVDGKLTKVSSQALSASHTLTLARAVMNDKQAAEFERTKECNFAISPPGVGRFRVNAFMQQGKVGMVLRVIPAVLPTLDGLGLPPVLKDVVMAKRGLAILVGATGSGKSTTMAAMLDWRNEQSYGHILTIEDPVEFVHLHKNCVVTQREVGLDTDSWASALKNSMRQAPDVILMGEIRDRESMEHALAFSETGHLCLATLHANSANQAMDRIINFFPDERRAQLLMDLSLNLKAVVSQRLVPRQNSKGRFAAVEVMLNSPLISDLIFKGFLKNLFQPPMTTSSAKTYEPAASCKVAFIGLGVMGYPMAGHLALAGHAVTVYNRSPAKAQAWSAEFKGALAATPREAALGADIVFCCVGNDDDLRSVTLGADGAFAGMQPGAIFVDHTTASATVARELHGAAKNLGLSFIDAPVSGGQAGAQNGALTVMCGGDATAFEAVKPVGMAFSKAFTLMGESGAGQLTKMVNQICIAGLVQGLSEAVAFGQKAGLDVNQVLGVIGKGAAQSWQLDNRGKTMVADQFDFGFAVDWMRKDLGLVLDEAKRNGARLPVTALVDQFYADVQAMGGQRWDTSSLVKRLK